MPVTSLPGESRLDVMPSDDRILGFSRCYKSAMESAQRVQLENDLTVRVVTAPLFLGTKLEVFKGRGKNDYFASHDLEDAIVSSMDGHLCPTKFGVHHKNCKLTWLLKFAV